MPYFREDSLKRYSRILFGPFVGELGWEIKRWAGFIRWFKLKNPNIIVEVCTRENRKELYTNCVDAVTTFEIEDDYDKYRPNQYNLDFYPDEKYQILLQYIKTTYPDYHIFESPRRTGNKNYFDPAKMDFNFNPTDPSIILVNTILKQNDSKIPIVISPRHRIDMKKTSGLRNWVDSYWNDLYNLIERHKKYVALVVGFGDTYKKPNQDNSSCYCLEHYIDESSGINSMGLVLAAIKKAKVMIGQQSALPILANHIGTPTIMWGHEQHRHQVLENPLNTRCIFIPERTTDYCTNPSIIYESIQKILGC